MISFIDKVHSGSISISLEGVRKCNVVENKDGISRDTFHGKVTFHLRGSRGNTNPWKYHLTPPIKKPQ